MHTRHATAGSPTLLRSFFDRSDTLIQAWFGHFSTSGIQHFKRGAPALAHYALGRRDEVWRHLVWAGRHPQAPVAVAAKVGGCLQL